MYSSNQSCTFCAFIGADWFVRTIANNMMLWSQYQLFLKLSFACVAHRKGFESDAHIRQFLARGSSRSRKADEAGPSQLDIRELRSLSLSMPSFSVLGPPIGVSLPDSDLKDLRVLVGANSSIRGDRGTPLRVC